MTDTNLTTQNDTFTAGAGNHEINGNGGNDTITTGAGYSTVTAGDGNDTITTGAGGGIINAGDGDNTITTGAGLSTVTTGAGDDTITTGAGDSMVAAGDGNNTITTGAGDSTVTAGDGNDTITTGAGDNIVNAGGGTDIVTAGAGNDVLIYSATENANVTVNDLYFGSAGSDTLKLVLTREEYMRTDVQTDIANYLAFLDANNGVNGGDNTASFTFSVFALTASQMENLAVTVDGVDIDPVDHLVTLDNDVVSTTENSASIAVDVLLNDSVPDLIYSLTHTQPASGNGSVLLTPAYSVTADDPSAKFIYTPNTGHYDYLAVGESATDTFTYTVTDATRDVETATVTVTIEGTNDAPIISLESSDSESETIVETDAGLTTQGTLTVSDIDTSDVVTASVVSVTTSGNNNDDSTPVNTALLSMLSVPSTNIINITETSNTLAWDFNSGSQAFDYLADDENLELTYTVKVADDNGASDTQTVTVTIEGTNDAPIISVESSDSDSETIVETDAGLTMQGTLTVFDIDTSDVVTASVASVTTSGNNNDASTPGNTALLNMFKVTPTDIINGTETLNTLDWTFDSDNQAFSYLADGENLELTYTVEVLDDNGASDTQTVTVTIEGTNDQPIVSDVNTAVGEDAASVVGYFVGSDTDSTDILSFEIIGKPMDSFGHQYGAIINNDDGSFTFDPLDNFQFLNAGESRDVTFQYVAKDDSGTGNNISDAKTVTVTVNGAYDAPILITEKVLFESSNQSMWNTGDAFQIDWREFYGASWDETFNESIVSSATHEIVPGFDVPVIPTFHGLSVTSPSVSIGGATTGRFGISPYFKLDSGSVNSNIPVDIDLTYDVQYESGDHISILTGYSVDSAASFNTASPSVTFGIDLVFEFNAWGNLSIGSSSAGGGGSYALFPTINIDIDEPNLPGTDINLLELTSATGLSSDIFDTDDVSWLTQDGAGGVTIQHPDYDTNLVLSFPSIDTEGVLTDPDTLISTGSDDVAILNIDLDEIVSEVTTYVPPMHHSDSKGLDFNYDLPWYVNDYLDIPDVNLDLFSVNWDFEFIDIDLITTLTAVQDFTLDIGDLPLMVTLENGDVINDFNMGDTIEFDLPDDWDVDLNGNTDGLMDYALSIDMDAMLNNWTTLDLDLSILARALKAQIGYSSDIVGGDNYSLFGTDNEGFLVAESFTLLNISPLATLFGDEDPLVSGFDLDGFNTVTYDDGFSIA